MALTDNGNGLSAADVAAVTGNNNGFMDLAVGEMVLFGLLSFSYSP